MNRHLVELARAAGLDPEYTSWRNEATIASEDSLLAMLRMLGPQLGFRCERPEDAESALATVVRSRWAEIVPAVVVGWAGVVDVTLALPADVDGDWEIEIVCESGATHRAAGRLYGLPADGHAWPGGVVHCVRHARIAVGEDGYHEVRWRALGVFGSALAICAPDKAYGGPGTGARRWGVFAPVYGLAPERGDRGDRGALAGDLGELATLFEQVARRGGSYVATLPILAQFLDEPCAFSPYSPASRLWWNELYLDLRPFGVDTRAPAIRADDNIDYREHYRWRRAQIDALAPALLASRGAEIDAWARAAGAYDYAAFRAFGERERTGWRAWKQHGESPTFVATRADAIAHGAEAARVDAHVVAQWALQQQLAKLSGGAVQLYLDLPVGVSCDSYEVWRWREQFLLDASAGAPPDPLFLGGQDWGLPPLSPIASRRDRHRYVIACARHHLRAAGMLRIDHIMGLFRLYCVPNGRPATDGVYLRYPHHELLAILALESNRAKCAIVGEDLGTVPEGVRPAMAKHGLFRLHVGQWHLPARVGDAPVPSPPGSVASLNTHDTATFAGWWRGADIDDKLDLGLVTKQAADLEHVDRATARIALLAFAGKAQPKLADAERAMVAATADLAAGPAEVVLVALDDLVLDPVPHNVPGTTTARPNWQRRIAGWRDVLDPAHAPPAAAAAIDAVIKARPYKPTSS